MPPERTRPRRADVNVLFHAADRRAADASRRRGSPPLAQALGGGWLLSVRPVADAHQVALLEVCKFQDPIAPKVVSPAIDRNEHRVILDHFAQARAVGAGGENFALDGPR